MITLSAFLSTDAEWRVAFAGRDSNYVLAQWLNGMEADFRPHDPTVSCAALAAIKLVTRDDQDGPLLRLRTHKSECGQLGASRARAMLVAGGGKMLPTTHGVNLILHSQGGP
jgi:hypothetical protein